MTAVIDASVLVSAVSNTDPHGEWSRAVLRADDMVSTAMVFAEATNGIRNLLLRRRLSSAEARLGVRDVLEMRDAITLHPFAPFAARVWDLRANLTAYDAWYVAVAETLPCTLYTLDLRLGNSPRVACPVVMPPAAGA